MTQILPSVGSERSVRRSNGSRERSGRVATYGTRAPAVLARLGFQVGMDAPTIGALTIGHCGRAEESGLRRHGVPQSTRQAHLPRASWVLYRDCPHSSATAEAAFTGARRAD